MEKHESLLSFMKIHTVAVGHMEAMKATKAHSLSPLLVDQHYSPDERQSSRAEMNAIVHHYTTKLNVRNAKVSEELAHK